MKKLILSVLEVFLFLATYGQVISGTVVDKKTNEKIPFVAIYFNGTFVGTTSNNDGEFSLDVSQNASMPLSVSSMGYESLTLDDYLKKEPLIIYLVAKEFDVDEVVVSAKSLLRKRKANLRLFKKEFLGSSANASGCKIVNEDDIYFNYETDNDTMKAFTKKPLLIKNWALGYSITYYLDMFEYYKETKSFVYKGNSIFEEEMTRPGEANRKIYEAKRKEAYLGSRMHFLRSLWADDLENAGFHLTNSVNKIVSYNDIVIQEAGNVQDKHNQYMKYISYPLPITIIYNNFAVSTMTPLNQRVYIDRVGLDVPGVFWEGEMLRKRVGDSLPYEYKLNDRKK